MNDAMKERELPQPSRSGQFRRMASFFVFCTLFALLLMQPRPGVAQGTTGTITGTVTDSSGAVVVGATVTVREVNTNSLHSATTSAIGTYRLTALQPGTYSVKVSQAGFKTVEQTGLVLQIDQVATVDLQLPVGLTEESVQVTSAPPVLQTEDSSIGQVIDSEAIQGAPLNGRLSVMGLIALAPGMQGVGAQDQMATRGLTVAAGTGSRNSYGALGVTLDGIINKEVTLQRGEPEVPSLDALSQFKVIASGASAEFNEPTQIIVATSSGANAFHGELLWYNRSKGTSAKSYFNGATKRPKYERNEFGGNLAGPVLIPHLFNGKDRSFFFFAYEGFRLDQASPKSTQQPTAKMRSGDFSEFLDAGGQCASKPYYCIYDPTTGQKFAGNVIPAGKLNPVSQNLMKLLMPMPTTSGTGTNTFENVDYSSNVDRISLRVDHKINENNSLRFTWMRAFYGPNTTVGNDSLQGGMSGDGEHNSQFIVGLTHTFSPTLVLDLNGSFFHLPIYRTPQNVKTKWESVIPGLTTQYVEGAPQISISNITSIGEQGSKDLEQVGQLNASVTKVLTRHTIKTGFGYLYDNHWNVSAQSPQRGSFSFNGQYTKSSSSSESTGIAFADFLLGLPNSTSQSTPAFLNTRNISSQWFGYVQDDWKPISKLTINAGIRYDLQWFGKGPYDMNSLWVPSLSKVVVFGNSYPSAVNSYYKNLLINNNLLALSSDAGISSNPFSYLGRNAHDFAPRLGFAYQLTPNTVLRGAGGIYFNLLAGSYVGNMFGQLPFTATNTYTNTSTYSAASTFTMNAPFSGTGAAAGRPGLNAEHKLTTPYTEQYNLALEHEFARNIGVRIGYVGQHNLKQNNHGGPGTPEPNLNLLDPVDITKTAAATAPYPVLGAITGTLQPMYHSTMNSLQVGAHKQMANGLAFSVEYQWTRVLGTENVQNPSGKHPDDSYGPIAGVTPQVLQVSYSYELPFGKGRMFLGNASDLSNKFLRGWEISGVVNAQTGQPFSVTYTATPSSKYPGLVNGRANRVPGVALYPSHKNKNLWFNPAAFTAPTDANGTAGGAYGNSGYDMLRGPNYQDWDLNLKKNTTFGERCKMQLRADAFNLFNHPNLGTPNANISNASTIGKITSTSGTPSYQARTLEFGMKFNF